MRKRSRETTKRAYLDAREKTRGGEKEETWKLGSTSAMVIGGKKLVIASMGDYRAVICRDGEAHWLSRGQLRKATKYWPPKLIPGMHNKYHFLYEYI